jgi:hypothetical protein
MKKLILTMALLVTLVSGANAELFFNFSIPGGFYWSFNSGNGFLADSGPSFTVQLNLAPSGVGTIDNATVGGGHDGDNITLWSMTYTSGQPLDAPHPGRGAGNTLDDLGWFELNEFTGTSPITLGTTFDAAVTAGSDPMVYGRIFQDSSIGVGDYYYDGPLEVVSIFNTSTSPFPLFPSYSLGRSGTDAQGEDLSFGNGMIDSYANGAGFGGQVVPEPGTWALFAMGILTLAGAKLRSRK